MVVSPKQTSGGDIVMMPESTSGSSTITVVVLVHPLSSVTVTVYEPAVIFVNESPGPMPPDQMYEKIRSSSSQIPIS